MTSHELAIDLPTGWKPREGLSANMDMVWGPEFRNARTFRIWLPDGQPFALTLPLPETVQINKTLRRTRR